MTAPAAIEWGDANKLGDTQSIVFDNMGEAVFVCDLERNLAYINPAAEALTGCRLAKARGKKCFEVICGPKSDCREDCPAGRITASGVTAELAKCCTGNRSGDEREVLAKIAPLKDDGHLTGYVLILDDINDRRRAEKLLRESEQRAKDFAESASDWFWETDTDNRLSYFAGNLPEVLGIDLHELLGRTPQELASQVRLVAGQEKNRKLSKILKNHEPYRNFEYTITNPSDGKRFFVVNGVPVFDDEGNFKGYRGTGAEITERKRTEDTLKNNEIKYRDLIEGSIQGIVIHRDFRPLFANQAFAEILGYDSPDEILALDSLTATFAPHERRHLTGYMKNRRAGKPAPTQYEHQSLRKDGSLIWLDNIVRVVNWEGEPAIQATLIDITKRKQAEENSHRLIAAINALTEYVIFLDADDRIVFCNKKFGRLNSPVLETLSPGTLFEDHLKAVLARGLIPDAQGREDDWLRERMERHRDPKGPFELMLHDGICILMHEQRLPGGETIAVGTDISEFKNTEEALRGAKGAAETANRAKSEFLASMSHELRTPLNAVLGFAQMLQFDPKRPLSPAQNEHVENILAGGNHLLELVNEILDLAQIEADQIPLSLENLNANEVVADSVALAIPLGKPRDIKIIDRFSNGPPSHLRTDRLRLKQVLINLLSNAVKYNKDGGTVTVDGGKTENGFLRLSVTDTGIGIAEEDHASVFQIFQRLGAEPTVAREGTGIGLTVTKLLVERMAGRTGFKSEEAAGSTFWIELPLASNEETLIWSDTMRVGVDAIDKDHQVLITLLNTVTHRSVDGTDLDEIIAELVKYTGHHFRREEVVMEVCDYPDLEKHRGLHRDLTAQVSDLADAWGKGHDTEHLHRLRKFLRNWLVDHIMNVDTGITKYAKGKKQDIRQALESSN